MVTLPYRWEQTAALPERAGVYGLDCYDPQSDVLIRPKPRSADPVTEPDSRGGPGARSHMVDRAVADRCRATGRRLSGRCRVRICRRLGRYLPARRS